jgi:hypothetical protein
MIDWCKRNLSPADSNFRFYHHDVSGLGVRGTTAPGIAGHQWVVFLQGRTPDMVDHFPPGEEGAEWLCGATGKAIATPT